MAIFSLFRKNVYRYYSNAHIFYLPFFGGKYNFFYDIKKDIANGCIFEIHKKMGILKWVYKI